MRRPSITVIIPASFNILSRVIAEGTSGAVEPKEIFIPFEVWNELRKESGRWVDPKVHGPHFLWQGIPIRPWDA